MGDLVDLQKVKEENQPHLEGAALCLECKHEWECVCLAGFYGGMECPNCHLMKGVFKHLCMCADSHYECNCGNCYFVFDENHTICTYCGKTHSFD